MAPLYHLQRYAVADAKHWWTDLSRKSLVFLGRFVAFLQFFGGLAELVLQLDVFLVGAEGVWVVLLVLVSVVLALNWVEFTRLIGLRRNLIFFCSLSSSFPFMPYTSMGLLVLFLDGERGTFFRAFGRHQETSCRAFWVCAMWFIWTRPSLVLAISVLLHFCPAVRSWGGSWSASQAPSATLWWRCSSCIRLHAESPAPGSLLLLIIEVIHRAVGSGSGGGGV